MADEKELSQNQPTGGLPDWVSSWAKGHAKGIATVLIGGVVVGSMMMSHHTATTPKKEQNPAPPVVLSPRSLLDQNEANKRRMQEVEKRQDDLNRRIQAMNQPPPTGNYQAQPSQGTRQVSPEEQMREQLAAEKYREQYTSLWTSPVSATHTDIQPETGNKPTANQENASDQTPNITLNVKRETDPNQAQFPYDNSIGPYHYIQRGEIFDGVLMTALDGEQGGIVLAQLQEPVFVKDTKTVLLPTGTNVIGTARSVTATGQRLLAVAFDRINEPDGYAISLDASPGLSQQGSTGLTGQVDNHWLSTFGTAIAIGAIGGLSQIGNSGNYLAYDPSVSIRNGVSSEMGMESTQVLNKFLNKLPTVKIPPGTRVHIALVQDLKGVPEWQNHRMIPGAL